MSDTREEIQFSIIMPALGEQERINQRTDRFQQIGGYTEIPFLEDVDLMRRIKQHGRKIRMQENKVLTSARRWETEGMFYTTFRNQVVLVLYYLGVSPERLAKLYRRR